MTDRLKTCSYPFCFKLVPRVEGGFRIDGFCSEECAETDAREEATDRIYTLGCELLSEPAIAKGDFPAMLEALRAGDTEPAPKGDE